MTVRRSGWSDTSQADTERMAEERAQEAFVRILSGEKVHRREPKIGYNGAAGVPIRAEILGRHGEVVITRNAYGAHCLNTPNVLFTDVDLDESLSSRVVLTYACRSCGARRGTSLGHGGGHRRVAGLGARLSLGSQTATGLRALVWRAQALRVSAHFASCRFVETLGHGAVDPQTESVRDLHDRMSRALEGLETA